jgi:hypothetical protein
MFACTPSDCFEKVIACMQQPGSITSSLAACSVREHYCVYPVCTSVFYHRQAAVCQSTQLRLKPEHNPFVHTVGQHVMQ